jgi:hypothetical protein
MKDKYFADVFTKAQKAFADNDPIILAEVISERRIVMSTKDYVRIAQIISNSCDDPRENIVVMKIGIDLHTYFVEDNPNYDADKFLKAARLRK